MYKCISEKEQFVVIDKFPDVNFHQENDDRSLIDAVRSGLNLPQLFPVHRLDKITSGILMFAKTPEAATKFANLFQTHQIEKYYVAISDLRPKKKQGLIKGDMERSRRSAWKLTRTMENPAITQFFSKSMGNGLRLFLLKPHTGKTHQIRVALKSIGAPALGDPLYYKSSNREKAIDRGYLHAFAVHFTFDGNIYQILNMPENGHFFTTPEFVETITQFTPPWELNWPKI